VDCGICPSCGDGRCVEEDCASCPADCGGCAGCGDGVCDEERENCLSCPDDCGTCDDCGDGACDARREDCFSCTTDCLSCAVCGNGACEAEDNETCVACPEDCGECPVYDCSDMLECALDTGFDDVTGLAGCAAQGCAEAQTALDNFLDCVFDQLFSGTCLFECIPERDEGPSDECQECLVAECAAEVAACYARGC
jgi:hypothetical protein